MRIVIAPDSFKGTATAAEVAAAIADGWRAERPDDDLVLVPMADGGEGTLDAFATAFPDAERLPVTVTGPDGRRVETSWLRLPDGRAVVELASTSGITLLDEPRPDAANTRGFGEAIAAALDAGATGLVLGIGGSASTDGGADMLIGLGGLVHLDPPEPEVPPRWRTGAELLDDVTGFDPTWMRRVPAGGVVVLTDVTTPLLGPTGAAAVFGPQKGVTPDRIAEFERRLGDWAACFHDVDPATPGAGAAGGTGFGLLAWGTVAAASGRPTSSWARGQAGISDSAPSSASGASGAATVALVPGAHAVADALGLPAAIAGADLVVTGEGRFDGQTATGKAPGVVAELARDRRAFLVAGAIDAPTDGFERAASLTVIATQTTGEPADALRDPLRFARIAGERLARAAS